MDKDYLLKKWLNNDLSEAEMQEFLAQEDAVFNQQLIEDAKLFKASHFSKMEDFEHFKNTYSSKSTASSSSNWYKPLLRIAAVVVITLGVYFSFFNNTMTEVATVAGEKTQVELPDGSNVHLNALSQITFNKNTWKEKREVQLQGEAYFKVAKGQKFDVLTSEGLVTVVGTQFNVKQRDNYFEVLCFEGQVQVIIEDYRELLSAGDAVILLDNKVSSRNTTYTQPQWINNKSVFDAVPLKEVFDELERQYKLTIQFEDVDLSRLFSGGFEHDNLPNALISVTQPMDLTFEMVTSNQVKIHAE